MGKPNFVMPPEEAASLIEELKRLSRELSKYIEMAEVDEAARQSNSFRAEGERVVQMLMQLADEYGVVLPDRPIPQMAENLERARKLQPIADAIAQLLQAVDDAVLAAEGACWENATAYYDALMRMAESDPALKAALRTVSDYFSNSSGGSGGPIGQA